MPARLTHVCTIVGAMTLLVPAFFVLLFIGHGIMVTILRTAKS